MLIKNCFLLTCLFLTFSGLCQAFDFDANKWTDFEGTLGKTGIQLSLFRFDNGELRGNYCYKKYETKIELAGTISGDKIVITEFVNGKATGRFEGKVFTDSRDRFEGTWTDASNTRTVEFKLALQAICGGNYEHRYNNFYGSDNDVEKFMKQVKASVLSGDKEWIANHVSYPLKTTLNKGKPITIKGKKQFMEAFDLIFYPEFKDMMRRLCVCNMFNNYQGVMLGNGQIWINNKPGSSERKFDFNIVAINN